MNEQKVRLSDIADELGLSTATVSYVLHGKTNMVSERTASRVREVLEKKGYLPRAAEVLLGENPSKIIGVVVNDHEKYEKHILEDAFIASALNSLSSETSKRGLQLMVKPVKSLDEIVSFSTMWNLEGLVLIGFCNTDYSKLRSQMRIPFAVYDSCGVTAERTCSINIDDRQGGFQVGEYFRRCGHRRVLCISDNDVNMDKERLDGFREGFGYGGSDFMLIPMIKNDRMKFYNNNLKLLENYTAIFAVSDFYAVDLIHFLDSHGISVPQKISVAGFDDTPLCGMVFPSLTSVRQDTAKRAECALESLRRLRDGEEIESTITLPTKLIIRESTRSL